MFVVKICQLAMIHLPFVCIYYWKLFKKSLCGWHRSLFDRIGVRPLQKKMENTSVIKFDCDFWRIIALIDLEYRQMKVCDNVHSLPCPTT